MEYNLNTISTKYIPEDENNFYYYDQCHTVGTDLKQPRTGHIGIIINNNTRWTDFAQAIFRFRKLNRGTYLTVIYVYDKENLELYDTNNKIYELLKNNEEKFNDSQCNGIKYQLLKAMVRKKSESYCEDQIYPEFLNNSKFNLETIKNYMKNNIHNLDEYLNKPNSIATIYNELTLIGDKLIPLVVGSGNEKEKEQDQEQNQDQEKSQEKDKQREIIKESIYTKLSQFKINNLCIIKDLNCEHCNIYNCIKLFNTDDILINNKNIYISYNFLELNLKRKYFKEEEFGIGNYLHDDPNINDTGRFCYIEFNNMILIEREDVALDFYLYKLPVYDYTGNLLVPFMSNLCNIDKENPLKESMLDIDHQFIKLLGIQNYINTNISKPIVDFSIDEIIAKITPIGIIVLSYHYLSRVTDRYNLDLQVINKINNIDTIDESTLTITIPEGLVHSNELLINIHFDEYSNILKLEGDGYKNIIPYRNFNEIYLQYKYNYRYNTHLSNPKKIRGFTVI
jgi:hypothetical protein